MLVLPKQIIQSTTAFEKRSSVASATIAAEYKFIQTAGYAAAGDGGGAFYKRASSEPSHSGKVQDSGGGWWEIIPDKGCLPVKAFGAVCDGSTDDTAAVRAALATMYALGGGNVILPFGFAKITGTIDLREYSHRRQLNTTTNAYEEVMVGIIGQGHEVSGISWYGGQDSDGKYGTAIIAAAGFYAFGASSKSTNGTYYTGTLRDFRIVAAGVTRGHAGSWPITNRFTTVASTVAGCELPDLATYPDDPITGSTLPTQGSAIPDDTASCGIYAELLGGGTIERVYTERFAYGIHVGVGYNGAIREHVARWCNCAIFFSGAVTATILENPCYERNAVGTLFATSSMIRVLGGVIQANYAGADVVLHTNNHSLVFDGVYFEASPKGVVIRTDSSGDFRNTHITFRNCHQLGLDIDTGAIDNMRIEDCTIRYVDSAADVNIRDVFTTARTDVKIYVRNNKRALTGVSPSGEKFGLFTEWTGTGVNCIVYEDTMTASETLVSQKIAGRVTKYRAAKNIAASTNVFALTIPEPSAQVSGWLNIRVWKHYQGSVSQSAYSVGYTRAAGAATLFAETTAVDTVTDPDTPTSSLSTLDGVTLTTGGTTGDNVLTISENGAPGSSTAACIIEVEHIAIESQAWGRMLI